MEQWIFHFMDEPAPTVKCDNKSNMLYQDFWDTVILDEKRYLVESERSTAARIKEAFTPYWVTEFGCDILVKEHDACALEKQQESIVTFVGLDDSKTYVHSTLTNAPNVRKRESVVEFGLLPTTQIEMGMRKFWGKLHGQRRLQQNAYFAFQSAIATGRDHHHHHHHHLGTPPTHCFQRHTVPANVSFPLVLSTIHAMTVSSITSDEEEMFNKYVSVYLFSKIGVLVNEAKSKEYCRSRINRCVTAIRELDRYLSPIKDVKFQEQVLDHLELFYKALKQLVPSTDKETTEISSNETVHQAVQSLTSPKFPVVRSSFKTKKTDKTQVQLEAIRNLDLSSLSEKSLPATCSSSLSVQDALVQMHQLNQHFWRLGLLLHDVADPSDVCINDMSRRLKWLDTVIDKVAVEARTNRRMMSVVIRSFKALAHWLCYCWADHIAAKAYPVYDTFAPSLDPSDLAHMVLDDKQAIQAMGYVRDYLVKRAASRPAKPFTNAKDTLLLASAVAREMKFQNEKFPIELAGAEAFVKDRLQKMRAQREQREALMASLTLARKNLKGAQLERTAVKRNMKSTLEKVEQCDRRVTGLSQNVETLENKMKDAGSPPPVVAFRLPDEEELAMQWMFFMFMPDEFKVLCGMTLSAQSQLWDDVPKFDLTNKTNLQDWFDTKLKGNPKIGERATRSALCLWAPSELLDLSSPTSNSGFRRRSRVLFPNCPTGTLTPMWTGGNDVFAPRDFSEKARSFTEKLPESADQSKFMLQFVEMMPTMEKENHGIAQGCMKPSWLTREQYHCFTSLRSSPRSQIRGLLHAICHDSLPFDHECVHVLIKQLLFQVGEQDWKADAFDTNNRGMDALAHALTCRASLLKDARKFAERLLIFGEIASLFGQYHEGCLSCARQFAAISRKWGDDLSKEYQDEPSIPEEVHWNIARFYGFAFLCYPVTSGDESDLLACSELVALFHHSSMMASSLAEQSLKFSVTYSMAARIKRIVDTVKGKPWILTKIVNLTRNNLLPDGLHWSPVAYQGKETGCFEVFLESNNKEICDHGQLISLNLLNGIVLVNGATPGVLPPSIINHPQYRQVFGDRNFEIEPMGFRHYRTRCFFDNSIAFDFVVDDSDRLQIVEIGPSSGERLLNVRSDAMDLPLVVSQMHSNWFSRNCNVVISRGKRYTDRKICYVTTDESTFMIPKKYQGLSLTETMSILPKCERLLNGKTSLTAVLSRFERGDFILHFVNADMSCLRYSLTRFNLDFEQRNGNVSSVQFRGYSLTTSQSLGGTLPELSSFLLMQEANEDNKILIPDISFEKTREGRFHLEKSTVWHDSMRYHVYKVHSRLQCPIAADTESRLLLASLYVWTSTLLPDPGVGLPGTTMATNLVRQCWKNEPLNELELQRLIQVSELSKRGNCVTLNLCCSWLYESSRSVGLVHRNQESEDACKHFNSIDLTARWHYGLDLKYAPRLLPQEELYLLNNEQPPGDIFRIPDQESELSRFVHDTEVNLKNDFVQQTHSPDSKRHFHLNRPNVLSPLGDKIWDDLESSHAIYTGLPLKALQGLSHPSSDSERLHHLTQEVKNRRNETEKQILSQFQICDRSVRHRLSLVACQAGKIVTILDLLVFLCDASALLPYVPHLKKERAEELYIRIRDWALLCVLEDKLCRVKRFINRKLTGEYWTITI